MVSRFNVGDHVRVATHCWDTGNDPWFFQFNRKGVVTRVYSSNTTFTVRVEYDIDFRQAGMGGNSYRDQDLELVEESGPW